MLEYIHRSEIDRCMENAEKRARECKRRRQIAWQRVARDMARNPKAYHGISRAELPRQDGEEVDDKYTDSLAVIGQRLLITLKKDPFNSKCQQKLEWIKNYFEGQHNG